MSQTPPPPPAGAPDPSSYFVPNTPPQKKRSPWYYVLGGFFVLMLLVTIFGEKQPIAVVKKQKAEAASREGLDQMRKALVPGGWTPRVGEEKRVPHVLDTARAYGEAAGLLKTVNPKTAEEKALVEKFRKALIQHQKEDFPKLRDKYADVGYAPGYPTVGIVSDPGKKTILFSSRGLKDEHSFEQFIDNQRDELVLLRFSKVQFQEKYDGDYTVYTLDSPKDTDLVAKVD